MSAAADHLLTFQMVVRYTLFATWQSAEDPSYHGRLLRLAAFALLLGAGFVSYPLAAFGQADSSATLIGRVTESDAGAGVAGALIELAGEQRSRTLSDSAGHFRLGPLPPGSYLVRASRLGYRARDTVVTLAAGETSIRISLETQPIPLLPLTVRSTKSEGGAAAERELFEREVIPGAVGISRREIREIPALAEPDLLRALQALPGVVALNDLSAQLHVRGGGPDQNLFLLDGARIFAPYHMFGMFGAFNTDAVGRTEFFRGALPARFGGALSSVIAIEQREDDSGPIAAEAGLSLLNARAVLRGETERADAKWLVAARRSHADLIYLQVTGDTFPYAFHDLQGRVSLTPGEGHRLSASLFVSGDRYRNALEGSADDLASTWTNAAGSVRWNWAGRGDWSASGTIWSSTYDGSLSVGSGQDPSSTGSDLGVAGLRLEAARRGESTGLRFGADIEAGRVDLIGSEEAGGYVQGSAQGSYALPALYLEAEHWLGRVRLAPGLRAGYETGVGRWLVEPRLAARLYLSDDITLTAGAGRTRQFLSTIRDDRFILPGPPLWFLHPEGAPVTASDGVDLALDGWYGYRWSYSAGVYARRFAAMPRWRPEGTRELSKVAYDDGSAAGVELMIRHHREPWTGWLGYGLGRTSFNEGPDSAGYHAAWDRHHAVDLAIFRQATARLSLSARVTYGSGLPFWPLAGLIRTARLNPTRTEGRGAILRLPFVETEIPIWADEQRRLPSLFRVDLGARYNARIGRIEVTPYVSMVNVTARANVLHYKVRTIRPGAVDDDVLSSSPWLEPMTSLPLPIFPTIGFDLRF